MTFHSHNIVTIACQDTMSPSYMFPTEEKKKNNFLSLTTKISFLKNVKRERKVFYFHTPHFIIAFF